MNALTLINPADGSIIGEQPIDSAAQVARRVEQARRAQPGWAALSLEVRAQAIGRFRQAVQSELEGLARTLTLETGKPLAHSRNELNAFLGRIDFFLAQAPVASAGAQVWDADGMREQIERIALGVVGNISAWNYPWFVGGNVFVPALLMGNAVKYAGTTGIRVEKLTESEAILSLKNRRKSQNHIGSVHAVATALLAESATGYLVGMNIPDRSVPVIKSLHIDYQKRASGDMTAVARLTDEQIRQMRDEEKGETLVEVTVTDGTGRAPIQCAMLWAWVPKVRKLDSQAS